MVRQAKVSNADILVLLRIGRIDGLMLGRLIEAACRADSDAFRAAFDVARFTVLGGLESVAVRSLQTTALGKHSLCARLMEVSRLCTLSLYDIGIMTC